jgi:hypothetical protein
MFSQEANCQSLACYPKSYSITQILSAQLVTRSVIIRYTVYTVLHTSCSSVLFILIEQTSRKTKHCSEIIILCHDSIYGLYIPMYKMHIIVFPVS